MSSAAPSPLPWGVRESALLFPAMAQAVRGPDDHASGLVRAKEIRPYARGAEVIGNPMVCTPC